jgi:hypothetical protein
MKRADAAGLLPTGSADNSSKRLATSGDPIAAAMSALTLSTMARGVFGGATTANHVEDGEAECLQQVGGLRSLESAVDVARRLSELADEVVADAVVHQVAIVGKPC